MYKSSNLCRLAICRRCILMLGLWLGLLLGGYELYQAAQNREGAGEGLRRLAIYGIIVRAQR